MDQGGVGMISGQEFIKRFEAYCPLWLAEEGDPVGLHVGTLNKPLERVMMTLDVRPEVVAEAIEKKIDLIIAKHPPIFRPLNRLLTDDPQQKMLMDLVKHDIAVYAAHTNMDIIEDGLNDWFCELLEVEPDTYLKQTHQVKMKKLAVFTPVESAPALRKALGKAGAGQQGNYQNTSYSLIGTGRFTPQQAAHPAIGEIGKEEQVQEAKIEVIFPETIENKVLSAMIAAHPYEEPAHDLYALDNLPKTYGIGRVGNLAEPLSLDQFVERVKERFGLTALRLVSFPGAPEKIQRIAICGGSGQSFYSDALRHQADVYITGDISYHFAHDMQANGLIGIDPGHNIEKECIPRFIEKFNQWKAEENWAVTFVPSTTSTNPFDYR
ncbi:Nif3-like dinuclear metal center hexameric protein [Enterococcus casseliflavus]|nr:Nif3-like dinuclear metal center hexameric protein [Enterococcus casseliflavus]